MFDKFKRSKQRHGHVPGNVKVIDGNHGGDHAPPPQQQQQAVTDQGSTGRSMSTAVYYANWSIYERNHLPLDIDYNVVDQVYYAFLVIDKSNGTLGFLDTWGDLEKPFDSPMTGEKVHGLVNLFRHIKHLHPRLKVSFSIGGWGADDSFLAIAHNKSLMVKFAKSCGDLVQTYGFDGIDIDWEYPKNNTEGKCFVEMVRLVRQQLDEVRPGLLLSVASPSSNEHCQHFIIDAMDRYLNYWNVMTYDFCGYGWSHHVGFHSNLYGDNGDNHLHADGVIQSYLGHGIAPHKIILGMPLYGRKFAGVDHPVIGSQFDKSKLTDEGIIDYKALPLHGSREYFDHRRIGAFCYDAANKMLIVYDNVQCIKSKALYVKKLGLGGGMFWDSAGDGKDQSLVQTFAEMVKN